MTPDFPILDPRGQLTPEARARLLERLKDPIWRLHHIYKIKDKAGRTIPFAPNPSQAALINSIYKHSQKLHIILKARQLGFSTLIALIFLDLAYFNEGINAAIVDQTQAAASDKLKKKVKFALENLAPELYHPPLVDNGNEIVFHNGSSIIAGKAIRGGTLQALHVSELGPIAAKDPTRSQEIITGALPAAEQGIIIIESTMDGGEGGDFYDAIDLARTTPEDQLTEKDYHFWFFPWYLDPAYTLDGPASAIPNDVHDYCDAKERELGITLSTGQRLWYAKTRAQQKLFMFREYPTTEQEAIEAPVKGAIYADLLGQIRAKGQIKDFLTDPAYPIYSVWDIGYSDDTSVWLFQLIGRDIHWLWHMSEKRLTAAEAWFKVQQTGHPITGTYLPHDAANGNAATGLSYKDALEKAGATHIRIIPRTKDIFAGINAAMGVIPRSLFHKTNCAQGLKALQAYHTEEDGSSPVHDWSSHTADAFRYGAEAISLGLIKTDTARRLVRDLDRYAIGGPPGIVDLDALRPLRSQVEPLLN